MFKKRKSAGASRNRLSFDPIENDDSKEEISIPTKKKIKQFGGAVDLALDGTPGTDGMSLLSKYGDAQSTTSKEQVYKDAIDQASDGKDADKPLLVDLDDHKRTAKVPEKEEEETFATTSSNYETSMSSLGSTSNTVYDSNVIALDSKQVQANVTRAYDRLMDQKREIAKVIDKLESELDIMKNDQKTKEEAYHASQGRKDHFSTFYSYMKQVTLLLTVKSKQQAQKISTLRKAWNVALSNKRPTRQALLASLGAEIEQCRGNSSDIRVKLGPCVMVVDSNGSVSCDVQDMLMATDISKSNSNDNVVDIDTLSTYQAYANDVSLSIKREVTHFYQEHFELLTSDSWKVIVPSIDESKEEVIVSIEDVLLTLSTFRRKHAELDGTFVSAVNKQKRWARGKDEEALDVYSKTYASLSLPEILHPLIIKDCLLDATCFICGPDADDATNDDNGTTETPFSWIRSVQNYMDTMDASNDTGDADGDSTLIVRMLRHSIVPFCKELVLSCFDPLYVQQWQYLARCIRVCRSYEQKLSASEWKLKLNDGIQELTRLAADKGKAVFVQILESDINDDNNVDAMAIV